MLEHAQGRAMELGKDLEHVMDEECLREVGGSVWRKGGLGERNGNL